MADTQSSASTSRPNAAQDAPIFKLPQELHEYILSFIQPDSESTCLFALSATCREMHEKTIQTIGRLYFSTLTVLLSNEYSMRCLRGISEHQTFSRSVKEIRFSFAKIFEASYPVDYDDYIYRRIVLGRPFPPVARRCPSLWGLGQRNYAQSYSYGEYLASQRMFLCSSHAFYDLRMILANFKTAGNIPAIIASPTDCMNPMFQRGTLGFGRIHDAIETDEEKIYDFAMDHDDHHLFQVTYEAILNADYPITHLELGCYSVGIPLAPTGFIPATPVFNSLKTLRIAIEPPTPQEISKASLSNEERLTSSLQHFVNFLNAAPNIEILGLSFAPQESVHEIRPKNIHRSHRIFAAVARSIHPGDLRESSGQGTLCNIQHLELYHFSFWFPDLLYFVRMTRSTLKSLSIDDQPEEMDDQMRSGSNWEEAVLEAHGGDGLELNGCIWWD